MIGNVVLNLNNKYIKDLDLEIFYNFCWNVLFLIVFSRCYMVMLIVYIVL